MEPHKNILICLDDPESADRLAGYVAAIVDPQKGVRMRLFHILPPMPPQLLEFGGAENGREEQRQDEAQKEARASWQRQTQQSTETVFRQAGALLARGGIPADAVETATFCCSSGENLAEDILQAARGCGCGTIVVGRRSFSWLDRVFSQHVADRLISEGAGLAVWVIE